MIVRDFATSGWVVSLDFPNSRDVIQPKYFDNGFIPPGGNEPFIPKREIKEWRSTDQILKLKNGSLIGFKSADSPASKFQGAGKDWVHFDEVPPKEHHDETVMRVEAGRKLVVFGTCTLLPPVGMAGGVSWLYLTTIKPWQEGKRDDVAVFTAGIRDNPFIGEEEIKGLESIHPPGSRQHDIRIIGKLVPGIGGSRAYHSFERTVHVRELGEMDPYKPVAWAWDFNVQPMATLVGQREQERFRFFYELILEEGNIPDMCEYFYNIMLNMTHRSEIWVYGDATGTHRNAQYGESDYRIIQNSMAKYGVPFRMKVPRNGVNPPVAERLGAMNRAMKDEVGESRIEVDPRCTELITDFENVLLEPHGGIKKSHNVKDPYYARTHTSDAAGYWVTYEAPIRRFLAKQSSGPKSVRGASYSFGTKPLV